jgi:hypothetical protein
MIAAFIVVSSLVLAAAFVVAWLLKPGLRQQVEDPKYSFQDQVERYNRELQQGQNEKIGGSDESS